jgi:hypothetical protein
MVALDLPTYSAATVARFWSKVDKDAPNGCWEWTAALYGNGYGHFTITKRDHVSTHRFSYRLKHDDFDQSLQVLHSCDNRKCVNPDHLFQGTQLDNMRDMHAKGRGRDSYEGGEAAPSTKLTTLEVRWVIRARREGLTFKAIAIRAGSASPMRERSVPGRPGERCCASDAP